MVYLHNLDENSLIKHPVCKTSFFCQDIFLTFTIFIQTRVCQQMLSDLKYYLKILHGAS